MARVIRKTYRKIKAPVSRKAIVKVGFPAGQADKLTISKAVWNEFGTRGGASGGGWGGPVPERPAMRNAIRDNKGKYKTNMAQGAKAILDGHVSLPAAMTRLGDMARSDIQAEIVSLSSPPNSPVTIELKGSSNPLIDTGEMHGAVTYKVET